MGKCVQKEEAEGAIAGALVSVLIVTAHILPTHSCGLTADSYRNAPKCPANMTLALTNDPFASLGKNTTAT